MADIWEALEALHRKSNEVAEVEEKKALLPK